MLSLNNFFNDPRVITLVSDRSMDFTLNGEPAFSGRQKVFLSKHLGPFAEKTVFLKQVHGDEVIPIRRSQPSSGFKEGDALITKERGVPLAVRSADCLPIFIFDPRTKAVGLVHAGWRGSRKAIVQNALRAMMRRWKTEPRHLKAAFGPAIRSCCYQVGEEFQAYFPDETRKRSDGFYLDLVLVNKNQLLGLGVKAENIFDCNLCTCCDSRFFSYRREGAKAGRMISVVMLRDGLGLERH